MAQLPSLNDLNVKNKRVLLRVDFNVPLMHDSKTGQLQIRDDSRIKSAIATIQWLLNQEAEKIILISHLGNPKGVDSSQSLRPVAERLEKLLGMKVIFASDCIGQAPFDAIKNSSSKLVLLENLRFHAGEKQLSQEPEFIRQLAQLGDCYVNDAFGAAHREDSSCVALAHAFKGNAAAGFLLSKEVNFLCHHVNQPERPFVAIVGGAKVSTKLGVLDQLLERCDRLIIVGAMAYTFMLAKGIKVGRSLAEPDFVEKAKVILEKAESKKIPFLLPSDVLITSSMEPGSTVRLVPTNHDLPDGFEGVDIGDQTILAIQKLINDAKTIFWNGPAGVFEQDRFAKGTKAIAQMLANHRAVTIVGGGDSTAAVNEMGLAEYFSHVSTGGGASLELIEKGDLPALAALREAF